MNPFAEAIIGIIVFTIGDIQLGPLEQKMYQLDYAIGRALDEWPNYET